jgi:hypothetical protein
MQSNNSSQTNACQSRTWAAHNAVEEVHAIGREYLWLYVKRAAERKDKCACEHREPGELPEQLVSDPVPMTWVSRPKVIFLKRNKHGRRDPVPYINVSVFLRLDKSGSEDVDLHNSQRDYPYWAAFHSGESEAIKRHSPAVLRA